MLRFTSTMDFLKDSFIIFYAIVERFKLEKKEGYRQLLIIFILQTVFFFFIVKKRYSRFVFFLIFFFPKFIYFFINIFSLLRKTAVLVCKAWLKTFTLLVKNKVIPFHIFFIAYFSYNFFLCFPFRLFKKKELWGCCKSLLQIPNSIFILFSMYLWCCILVLS